MPSDSLEGSPAARKRQPELLPCLCLYDSRAPHVNVTLFPLSDSVCWASGGPTGLDGPMAVAGRLVKARVDLGFCSFSFS
jgi:hypothetical protein